MGNVMREEIVNRAVEFCCERHRVTPEIDSITHIFSAGQNFYEYVTGQSLNVLAKYIDQLMDNTDHKCINEMYSPVENKRLFHVLDDQGYPNYSIAISGDGHNEKRYIELCLLDADNIDYPYPQIVALVNNMPNEYISTTSPSKMFGHLITSMNMLRPMITPLMKESDISAKQKAIPSFNADGHLNYGDILELDGGIAGTACEEVAVAIQENTIKHIMPFNRESFKQLHNVMSQKNITWGDNYIEYNDCDNKSCAIPLNDGSLAMVHLSSDFIEPGTGYIAVGEKDSSAEIEQMSIYFVDPAEDNIPLIVEALQSGFLRETPIFKYNFKEERIHLNEKLESTGIAYVFSFHLNWELEVITHDRTLGESVDVISFDERNEFQFDEEEDNLTGGITL